MQVIRLPRINANDEAGVIQSWLVSEGQQIDAGTPIAVVEYAKTAVEIESEHAGVLQQVTAVGEQLKIGEVLAHVFATLEEWTRARALSPQRERVSGSATEAPIAELTITRPAQELMNAHGIDPSVLRGLGKTVIKRSDIEALLAAAPSGPAPIPLSMNQLAVARTVSESAATIPAAFVSMRVYVDDLLQRLKQLMQAEDAGLLGLSEVLVKVTADLFDDFPVCFGSFREPGHWLPASAPHLGVTMDLGNGLFVPVVRDPRGLPLVEIANQLMDLRYKALRNQFEPSDLEGARLTISLNAEEDVSMVVPLVFPGQACTLALGAPQQAWIGQDGVGSARTIVQLSLAYDHRLLNGHSATRFLKAIKTRLESGPLA